MIPVHNHLSSQGMCLVNRYVPPSVLDRERGHMFLGMFLLYLTV